MTYDLFEEIPNPNPQTIHLAEGAQVLPSFAREMDDSLLNAVKQIITQAPLRHMTTPNGFQMSVAMSNCGQLGWVSDRKGYRYEPIDPITRKTWPTLPGIFLDLAKKAASYTGFENFLPDACLINCYEPGTRLSLHQDKDEHDSKAPIVSVSLGLPAIFLFGGLQREHPATRHRLEHGDVVVWGGPSRFVYHGIAPLANEYHSKVGRKRINLTFRRVF